MRKFKFVIFTALTVLMAACSAYDEPVVKETVDKEFNPAVNRLTVSQAEKLASEVIADFHEEDVTRTEVPTPDVEFILRSAKTRSVATNDTIAFVFNYPDNGGFVMMSPDPTLDEPLIAYSDKGHLDINDDFVKNQIIYPLEDYIETISSSPATRIELPTPDPGVSVVYEAVEYISPKVLISLNQNAPWNKVVVEVHNGINYVTGCVPVAAALIMSRCKSNFTLRDKYYNFAEITKCIAIYQGVPGLGSTTYSYDTAVNQMAQLLSDIGQEFDAKYRIVDNEYKTSAGSDDAFSKLISWGYTSPFNNLRYDYNVDTLKSLLDEGNIVYVTGWRENDGKRSAHAWVADGNQVRRMKSNLPGIVYPSTTYAHFNWGWGVSYDGYFSGYVYTPYDGCSYHASGREYAAFKLP